jgi:hypothetical protein
MDQQKIHNYILSQLQSGITSQDIATQLRQAGWDEAAIQAAFSSVAATIQATPTQPQAEPEATAVQSDQLVTEQQEPAEVTQNQSAEAPGEQTTQTLPPPLKAGRMKVGWLLFKQSLKVIKSAPGLSLYVILSIFITLAVEILIAGIVLANLAWWHIVPAGGFSDAAQYIGIFLFILITTFITYFFTVALSAHVLALFKGQTTTFADNVAIARQKIPAIATYALIATTVGFILRLIEERSQLLGKLISYFLGALWSLLTTFTLPVIADSDKSGLSSVKESFRLFKNTWGQTITSRVVLSGIAFLFYLLIILPVTVALVFVCLPLGTLGLLIPLGFFVITLIAFVTLVTMATNVLNVSLYYYARYGAVPPAFDPALLASVFIEKKKKGDQQQ